VPQAGYGSYLLGEADNGNITYFRKVDGCTNIDLSCNCTGFTSAPAITYTLTYNYNETQGGTGTEPTPTAYSGGSAVVISPNPNFSATGKLFGGWNTSADGTGIYYPPASTLTMPYANTTLWAQWYDPNGPLFQVIYNTNGGTSGNPPPIGDYSQYQGVPISGNIGNLQRTGFTFAGWNTEDDGSGTAYPVTSNGFTMPPSTQILYAQWTPIPTYTVTYFGNTNTSGTAPVDGSSPYLSGSSVTVLGNTGSLVKTGFTFAGWNTAENGSGISYSPLDTFIINSNTSLHAQWTPVGPSSNYTVTYNGNGNTNTSVSAPVDTNSPYVSGSTVTVLGNPLAPNTLVKTGFQFAGWNTAADGSGTNYVGADTFNITQNTTLYAKWLIQQSPRLVYNANSAAGGIGTAPSSSGTSYPPYSTVDIVGNTFTNTDITYSFGGWNTAANGSGTSYPVGSEITMPGSGTVNLFAQWINPDPLENKTLTYDANAAAGGSGTPPASPTSYSSNAPATILGNTGPFTNSDPTKIFYGWNTAADGSGTSYPPGSTITMNTNKILYAQWGSTPLLTVTYNANGATGGSVPAAPTNYPTGVQVPILGQGSLTRPGYTFLGWNSATDGSGSAYVPGYTFTSKTATLYAHWAPGSSIRNCGTNSITGIGVTLFSPYGQFIQSSDTITLYITVLVGTTTTNYGSGLGPYGVISISGKTVITQTNIQVFTNTTYANPANDFNYTKTVTNGVDVTYWPSGAIISSLTFTTQNRTNSNGPPTYSLATTNSFGGCGSTTTNNWTFLNQTLTMNFSNGTNTFIANSPNNFFYTTNGGTTFTNPPKTLYPYADYVGNVAGLPKSDNTITTITLIPSTGSSYVYPPLPNYTVEYNGNGNTGGFSLPIPQFMTPYSGTTSITISGNTGSLTKTGFTFSGWNTAADGSGTNYAGGATYTGGASLTLYAKWV